MSLPRVRHLVALAVPAAASVLLNNAYRVLDQAAAGWIGPDAQAAIGSVTFVLILAYAAFSLVAAGAGPLVARATGAGDDAARSRLSGLSLGAAAVVGVAVWAVLYAVAGPVASALGLTGAPAALAADYLRALALCGLPIALGPVIDALFIAIGRPGWSLALHALSTLLNALLNDVFVRQAGWGVDGAAWASGLSRGVAVLLGLLVLWGLVRPRRGPLADLARVLRLGAPIALNVAAYALVYWVLLRVAISPLGPAANAALGIGFSALESVTWPIFHGLSLAVAGEVGRQLGAGRPAEAQAVARAAFPLATALGLVAAAAFYFGAEALCAPFTDDPAVFAAAVLYARVLAFSQLFVAGESLAEGVLEGAGDTRGVLWWSSPLNAARIPLAWALAIGLGWGAAGVWWAINASTWAKAAGKGWRAWRGAWARLVI